MKNTIIFLSVLLAIWIAGCTYYYMCKVRNHCDRNPVLTESVQTQPEMAVAPEILADSLANFSQDNPPPPPPPPPPPAAFVMLFNSGAGSCELTPAHRAYFASIKKNSESNANSRFVVTGHADSSGPESMNQQLSEQRAQFVKKQLLEAGVASERITVMGKGENDPVADNGTPEGRSKNRRVEIQPN
ncbi:MAG: OmpA family protein [Bacteroidales bacterium]|nr:OmpA family protein [Bacteroidales bacterium]